ncbi:MAG: VWA domain-containing protein [SAR324 cluster bacterium]|nr:VWA domain-containing protein [SAR324 cluster bacterium]
MKDGSTYLIPENITRLSIVSDTVDGALFQDTSGHVHGFVTTLDMSATAATTASGAMDLIIPTLQQSLGITSGESILAVAVATSSAGKTTGGAVNGNYSVPLATATTGHELVLKILESLGIKNFQVSGTVVNGSATQAFRLQVSLLYRNAADVLLAAAVVPTTNYDVYQGLINGAVNFTNIINYGITLKTTRNIFTAGERIQKADFLMVVDNSGSMNEEQVAVANNATNFFTKLANAGLDFMIGVITTGPTYKAASEIDLDGDILRGTGFTKDKASFETAVKVGIDGSGIESGLYFAEKSLLAGGTVVTAGYPRSGATLSVIFISDERDQYSSYGSNAAFNFESNLFVDNGYLAHAIVADPDTGCSGTGGNASGSEDYKKLVNKTGGTYGNICQADYGATLDIIIQQARGGRYQLTEKDVPYSRIQVTVNGVEILPLSGENGFLYNFASRTITFFGTAIPQEGAEVIVTYKYPQLNPGFLNLPENTEPLERQKNH